ncbi:Hint domain-containing protein [Commensalibacter oyaizuii]|uniref:Hint domain-containing protein n=1 Tax=Commensalibacter oyaizuii TaxID=3043873 RepID=A0ABT6Q454_9PROT|nr:Hint domain-containing protein [Commensalibacter sp. TBRC 16381]MDI2091892.1 Hint domain-containing protein [Commensalibacter sp. TBRC 16381]
MTNTNITGPIDQVWQDSATYAIADGTTSADTPSLLSKPSSISTWGFNNIKSVEIPAGAISTMQASEALLGQKLLPNVKITLSRLDVNQQPIVLTVSLSYVGYGTDTDLAQPFTIMRFGINNITNSSDPNFNTTAFLNQKWEVALIPNHNVVGISPSGWTLNEFPPEIKCFLKGTEIETPSGKKNVEELKVGDDIITIHNGNKVVKKITSILNQKVIANHIDKLPIRIYKSAIAENVPYKDLLVTPEHCLYIDGQFIPARMLVNGRSIIQDTSFNTYDVYHIETEEHSIVIADGMLTESYLNTDIQVNEFMTVKGQKTWEKDAAAPLNTSRDFAETIYKQIEERAKLQNLPDIRQHYELTSDHGLYLTTSTGKKLEALRTTDNYIMFRIPSNVDKVTLHSFSSRPSDVIGPYIDDRRNLGVLVGDISLSDGNENYVIDTHLNTSSLLGWSVIETSNCRWTLGNAELPLPSRRKNSIGILKISIVAGGPYIVNNKQYKNQKVS